MSLNWDLTGCPNWKEHEKDKDGKQLYAMYLDGKPLPWHITDALIWATMMVDLGWDIKKDIEEFVFRIEYYQQVMGPLLVEGGKPRPITPEEVRAHAGMDVNVSTRTRKQFLKRIGEMKAEEVERSLKKAVEA